MLGRFKCLQAVESGHPLKPPECCPCAICEPAGHAPWESGLPAQRGAIGAFKHQDPVTVTRAVLCWRYELFLA